MAVINKYRLHCTTDNIDEYVLATVPPTVCPTNAGHTIDTASITNVESGILINDGTPKDLALADEKQLRYNEIDGRTVQLIGAGFTYDSQTFSLSVTAQTNWNTLHNAESDFTWPVDVSTINNDSYSLAQANLGAFWTAAKDTTKGHLDSGRALKKSVFDATDENGVNAVVDTR